MTTLTDFNRTDLVDDHLAGDVNNLIAATLRSEYKNVETLSATRTLLDADTPIQRYECGAADRIVKAPTEDAVNNHPFFIVNASAAARTITVKDNAGAVTIATLTQGQACLVLPDGNGGYLRASGERETDYKITPTVSSNNLILTITHADGTTPSAGRPLWVKINNTWRAIVDALFVTKNAATNWANLGSGELATKEVDLFPYLIWNTNLTPDAVDIGWSRVPYGNLYSDFSGTTTNEKYLAINATAPAATDDCVNIGRFAATLSAGAGYTWTIPTYTSANLIHKPIYETRWLSYVPGGGGLITGFSVNPTATISEYRFVGTEIQVREREGGMGTSNATTFSWTAPFTAKTVTYGMWAGQGYGSDNSIDLTMPTQITITTGSNVLNCASDMINAWTASGTKRIRYIQINYPVA